MNEHLIEQPISGYQETGELFDTSIQTLTWGYREITQVNTVS